MWGAGRNCFADSGVVPAANKMPHVAANNHPAVSLGRAATPARASMRIPKDGNAIAAVAGSTKAPAICVTHAGAMAAAATSIPEMYGAVA